MSSMSPYDLITKADRAILSARLLYEAGDMEGACNRAYYAIFNSAQAVLLVTVPTINPVIGKTHSGLISAFGLHMVKTGLIPAEFGRIFNLAHDMRKVADYRGDPIEEKEAGWIVQQATNFIRFIKTGFMQNLSLDTVEIDDNNPVPR